MTVRREGFETQSHTGVLLDAGAEAVLEVALKVGSVSTTVEVTGGASVVEPSRVNTGRTIGHEEVDNLPLTSRNPTTSSSFSPASAATPIRNSASRAPSTPTGCSTASTTRWTAW